MKKLEEEKYFGEKDTRILSNTQERFDCVITIKKHARGMIYVGVYSDEKGADFRPLLARARQESKKNAHFRPSSNLSHDSTHIYETALYRRDCGAEIECNLSPPLITESARFFFVAAPPPHVQTIE